MKAPQKKTNLVPDLDYDRPYIATLVDLEERVNADDPDRFNDRGQVVSKVRVIWKYQLKEYPSGKPVTYAGRGGEQKPYEVWGWTSESTYFDPTGRMTSRGREYMHALLGRVLNDDEVAELVTDSGGEETLPYSLCGRSALVELRQYASNGRDRVGIASIRRLPNAQPQGESEAAAANDDLPF